MSFDAPAATALFQALESHAMKLGIFDTVGTHSPRNAPGRGVNCAIMLGPIAADPGASGLAATSIRITFQIHIYSSMMQRPLDAIDPAVLGAVATLLNEYNGAFTLGGTVRNVDVLGARAAPVYLVQDGKEFRLTEITLTVVVNDAWAQVA